LLLQLYVDDPVVATCGSDLETARAIDVLLLWWLVLGVPLAWKKGREARGEHSWIGVVFRPLADHSVVMTLPAAFLEELLEKLEPFCQKNGAVPTQLAVKLLGKAGKVAYIIPSSTPFVGSLWGALTAAQHADRTGAKEAPPGQVAVRRFTSGACWLRALVRGEERALMPLTRIVHPGGPLRWPRSRDVIEFDASPWGGGAARRRNGRYVDHFALEWSEDLFPGLPVEIGQPKSQTFFEFVTLLLTLMVWGDSYTEERVTILGDNTGALQEALSLKGRGALLAVSRELAWRVARHSWLYSVAHLPSEHNSVADSLSRLWGPEPAAKPRELGRSRQLTPPWLGAAWRARADAGP